MTQPAVACLSILLPFTHFKCQIIYELSI